MFSFLFILYLMLVIGKKILCFVSGTQLLIVGDEHFYAMKTMHFTNLQTKNLSYHRTKSLRSVGNDQLVFAVPVTLTFS